MPQVIILYTNEDLENIKTIDPNINTIEDYIKIPEEEVFVK